MPDPSPAVPEPLSLLDADSTAIEVTSFPTSAREVTVSPKVAARLTSIHTATLTAELGKHDRFTATPPGVSEERLKHLDADGRITRGAEVAPGDLLVGMQGIRFPSEMSPEERELAARAPKPEALRDRSLSCPPNVRGKVVDVAEVKGKVEVTIREERRLAVGDVLRADTGAVATVGALSADASTVGVLWPGLSGTHRIEKIGTAEDALEARSIGPYSIVTQQPLGGKARVGGQRVGPRAIRALLDRGASVLVHEMLTVKSDDVAGRVRLYESIVRGRPECNPWMAAGTQVLEAELRALGFTVDLAVATPRLGLLTTEAIRRLAPKVVTKPETLNYRTFQPEPGGLFCLEVFGPFEGEARRRTLGRIELPMPVLPPWSRPAVATLLGLTTSELENKLGIGPKPNPEMVSPASLEVRDALAALDLEALGRATDARGDLARDLAAAGLKPVDLLLEAWPVLPPDLRPLVPLTGGRFATSDLNDLYRRIINRSNRLRRLLELKAPDVILVNEALILQQAIDSLVHNGAFGQVLLGPEKRPLTSLADMVGGPRGRFVHLNQGKRVDYSARGRVVERSDLKPSHVRIPREVAWEVFRPWTYALLEADGLVTTIKGAKKMVTARAPEALAALERVAIGYPVVLLPGEDSDAVLSLEVQLWDEPAIALPTSAIAALGLGPDATVCLHFPVDPLAMEEARSHLRGVVELKPERLDEGWLSRATRAPLESLGETLFRAALHQETDAGTSRIARLILGRLP